MCWHYNTIQFHFISPRSLSCLYIAPWFHHRPNMLVKDTVVYRPNHGAPCTNIQGGPERICWPLTGRMDFYTPFGLGYGGLKGDSPMRKYYRHYYFIFTIWYWLKALFSISCHFFFSFFPPLFSFLFLKIIFCCFPIIADYLLIFWLSLWFNKTYKNTQNNATQVYDH